MQIINIYSKNRKAFDHVPEAGMKLFIILKDNHLVKKYIKITKIIKCFKTP